MTVVAISEAKLEPGATIRLHGYAAAKPISVGVNLADKPTVWFEQHGEGGCVDVEVMTIANGEEFQSFGWQYIGSLVLRDDRAFHAYWRAVHK